MAKLVVIEAGRCLAETVLELWTCFNVLQVSPQDEVQEEESPAEPLTVGDSGEEETKGTQQLTC